MEAFRRMEERKITIREVETVVADGHVIKTYPGDKPYPSRLVLGTVAGRPLHVVVADAPQATIVITAYQPDPTLWNETFTEKVVR